MRSSFKVLSVNDLLDLCLDGLNANGRLSPKTRFDYRHYADFYVRPLLGTRTVRDITPEVLLTWQRHLTQGGGVRNGKPLAPKRHSAGRHRRQGCTPTRPFTWAADAGERE